MEFKNLLWQIDENILFITINRPDKLNALNGDTLVEIKEAFLAAKNITTLKGIIITGAGEKAFVAGADIGKHSSLSEFS